jgi:hypothetical protein
MSARTPIPELRLMNSPNLKRALKRGAAPPKAMAKRAEMEEMFRDVWERRKEALADIKSNGLVIRIEKSNSRGALYEAKIANPAVKIAQACERQLCSLAKVLTEEEVTPENKSPMDELNEIIARSN